MASIKYNWTYHATLGYHKALYWHEYFADRQETTLYDSQQYSRENADFIVNLAWSQHNVAKLSFTDIIDICIFPTRRFSTLKIGNLHLP